MVRSNNYSQTDDAIIVRSITFRKNYNPITAVTMLTKIGQQEDLDTE